LHRPVLELSQQGGKTISALQWYPRDSGLLVSGASTARLVVWDPNSEKVAASFRLSKEVRCARFPPPSTAAHTLLAVGTEDSLVRLCDLVSGSMSHTLLGHEDAVDACAWSPLHEYHLATASRDRSVRVWDVRRVSSQLYCIPDAHDGRVSAAEFGLEGQLLLTAGGDQRVRCWSSFDGHSLPMHFEAKPRACKQAIVPLAGDKAALLCGPYVQVHCLRTGVLLSRLQGHIAPLTAAATTLHPLPSVFTASCDHQLLRWSSGHSDFS
jgi:DNA excision repair protein ERCC-8